MKIKLLGFAALLSLPLVSNAATVTVESNITTFLAGASGLTKDVTFSDGLIGSVTLRFTITTLSGESFTDLGSRVAVGPANATDDTNHFDQGEDVTFDVMYLSSTGAVDLPSISFRFDQIGFRGGGSLDDTITWKVNGSTVTSFAAGGAVAGATELYRTLDSSFTTIGANPDLYSGTISTTRTGFFPYNGTSQFSNLAVETGLQFSVNYVPEPSSTVLFGLGALAVLRRRR